MSESKILKPFVITVEFTAVVMAEDYSHARDVARLHKRDICSDTDGTYSPAVEIGNEQQLRLHVWDGLCLPYGGDGNQRMHQILAAIEALPMRDTKTLDMFADQKS